MSGFVGQLRARLGLDSAEFNAGLRNARQQATGFAASAAQGLRGISSLALGAAAFGGVATAAAASVRAVVGSVAQIGDLARRAGLPVEDFQELGYVAAQARVPLDEVTDGFKELSLRADEWIQTGSGPGEESFRRLGFTADDLARRLQHPADLFIEIVRRMQRFDTAARMRISDELFGGTAGERFVALIDQGADSLDQARQRARDLGLVMSEELVGHASDIDARFSELATRIANYGRRAVVGWAMIGEGIADALTTDDAERAAADLSQSYVDLAGDARDTQSVLQYLADTAAQLGDERFARVLAQLADATRATADAFRDGAITGDRFRELLGQLAGGADTALGAISSIDDVTLTDAMSVIEDLRAQLATLAEQAAVTAREVGGALGMTTGDPLAAVTLPQDMLGGRRSHAPPRAPNEGSPAYGGRGGASGGSGGGGGGSGSGEDYAAAVADIRARTEALIAEAEALADVAASGRDYGDAAAYARERAELLTRAQREGREITPELTAEIDALAQANVAAQGRVDGLTDALTRQREAGARGAEAVTDLFMAAAEGGDAARNAVIRLVLEIARLQAMRGLQGLAGSSGGGWLRWLGGLLGKNARGTESWRGGLTVVGEEGPELARLPTGTQITPALESERILRNAAATPGPMRVTMGFDPSMGAFTGYVLDATGRQLAAATPQIVGQSVAATHASFREYRPR